jgi:AcrR family transcriptional regulator
MTVKKQTAAGTKRAARSARRRKQTREEILDVAREVIFATGFQSFALTAVAEELGLTKPALYYYFPSKEALLFEVVLDELVASAAEIQAAVEQTDTGADAVEALMRTCFDRYRDNLRAFALTHTVGSIPPEYRKLVGPAELERIRPINDMTYGGTEQRLRADQRAGRFPKHRNPRRFAFTAHMAVTGVLNMKAITESANDPLIHRDDDLIDSLCKTFRAAASGDKR